MDSNKTLNVKLGSLPRRSPSKRLLDPNVLFETPNIRDIAKIGRRYQSQMRNGYDQRSRNDKNFLSQRGSTIDIDVAQGRNNSVISL